MIFVISCMGIYGVSFPQKSLEAAQKDNKRTPTNLKEIPQKSQTLPKNSLPDPYLSNLFRQILLTQIPKPLLKESIGWGEQKEFTTGVSLTHERPRLLPVPIKKTMNHGTWRKIEVFAHNPEELLRLSVDQIHPVGNNKMAFRINVTCPLKWNFEQQIWKRGIRIYSGQTRGRCLVGILLQCELESKIQKSKNSFLPAITFSPRVVKANLGYNQMVIEHTLGVGGEAAKFLGQSFFDLLKQIKPHLEGDLLNKANQGIVNTTNRKDIHLQFEKWFKK